MLSTIALIGALLQEAARPPELVTLGLTAAGIAINTAGVWFLVQLIKRKLPWIQAEAPHLIPLLAILSGPVLNAAGALASEYFLVAIDMRPLIDALGGSIDFSPAVGALAGPSAVALDQVYRQHRKGGSP